MIVCITASGAGADAPLDSRFGRAPYLVTADTDANEIQSEPNGFVSGSGGVGSRVAQMVVESGAGAVITGQVGPNAFRVLEAGGVEVYQAQASTVGEALALYREGKLSRVDRPGPAHHGIG